MVGVFEFAVILFVVFLLFGYKQLPKLGAGVGKMIHGIRSGVSRDFDEVNDEGDPVEPSAVRPAAAHAR